MTKFLDPDVADDYWGDEESDDYYDYNEDTDEEEADLEDYEREQAAKRRELKAQQLTSLKARKIDQDDNERIMAELAVERAKQNPAANITAEPKLRKLRPPVYADHSIQWEHVDIGKGRHCLRIGASITTLPGSETQKPLLAMYGGKDENGKLFGDGQFIEFPDPNDTNAKVNGVLRLKTKGLPQESAKPRALTGHSLVYVRGRDTLMVVCGARKTGERVNDIAMLAMPRRNAHWGAQHQALPDFDALKKAYDALPRGQKVASGPLSLCTCFRPVRHYNDTYAHTRPYQAPHRAIPVSSLPELAYHSIVAYGAYPLIIGGRTKGGAMNADVFSLSSEVSQRIIPQPPTRWNPAVGHRSLGFLVYDQTEHFISHTKLPLTFECKYIPTSGHTSTLVAQIIYIIGGVGAGGKFTNAIFQLDMSSKSIRAFDVRAGRLPPIAFHTTTLVRDRLIVFGGVAQSGAKLNNIYMISLTHHTIDQLVVTQDVPPAPRARHCAALVGDDLLVFGGETADKRVGGALLLRNVLSLRTQESFVASFATLLDTDTFSDVTIVNGGTKIHAHRVLLTARCAFFNELVGASAQSRTIVLEAAQSADDIARSIRVIRQGVNTTLMVNEPHSEYLAFLRFLYTDTVDFEHCNIEILTKIASDYECKELVQMCRSLADDSIVVPASSFVASLRNCMNQAAYSDVRLQVGAHAVHAHRCVLVNRSGYFATLLQGQFKEANEHSIVIHDVEYELFMAALTFIYTGFVDANNPQEIFELFYVANFWSLPELKDKVETLLLEFLDAENACLFYEAANDCNASDHFKQRCGDYIRRHFGAMIGGDDAEAFLEDVVRARVELDAADAAVAAESAHDPLANGWVPRQMIADCDECALPFLYDPNTWKQDKSPMAMLNEWAAAHSSLPNPIFDSVVDPMSIGHRINIRLEHLPSDKTVRLLRSFRTKKAARQNAALCALHHMHLVETKHTK